MRIRPLLVLVLAASAATAFAQQALLCPPGSAVSGKACDVYHYHVQVFRPDTRKLFEVTGFNTFATQAACDRARDEHVRRNLAVVDYFKRVKGEQQYEPDRFGPCHCDMTREKTNPAYLPDAQRQLQIRTAEDIRLRVREKLLDSGQTSESELVRSLVFAPPTLPTIGGAKLVVLPPTSSAVAAMNSPDDLRATTAVDTRPPAAMALDLPLVDVGASTPPVSAPQTAVTAAPAPTSAPAPQPADPVLAVPPVQQATIAAPEGDSPAPAEAAAEEFITYETDRIQSVLKAASAISDEDVKSRIIEASLQRNQLLSNLRTLIEGSGERSRLAAAVRTAKSEGDHIALAEKLFGSSMSRHWAPKDAVDVVLPPMPEVDVEPERVLRDPTGRFDEQQKKRALYDMLAKSQPTDEQQLWLVTVIDTMLR